MSAVGSDQAATAGAGKAAPVLTAAEKQTPPPSNLHHNTPNNSTLLLFPAVSDTPTPTYPVRLGDPLRRRI